MLESLVMHLVLAVLAGACFGAGYVARQWLDRRRSRGLKAALMDPGVSVEVDCHACGKFNRVPSHRLRDRPKCGRCKVLLMPGKSLVICRVLPMNVRFRAELDGLWTDEARLWQCLADYLTLDAKARAEAEDPSLRVVN